jgi:hypothetical protein
MKRPNRKHSIEARNKQSERMKGISSNKKGKPNSIEQNQKQSERMIGWIMPDSHRQAMRNAHLGKKKKIVTCPHCNKSGGEGSMYRWHFNNCKFNLNLK